jgi:hypothetical protein
LRRDKALGIMIELYTAYIRSPPSRPDAMPKSKKKTGEPEAK